MSDISYLLFSPSCFFRGCDISLVSDTCSPLFSLPCFLFSSFSNPLTWPFQILKRSHPRLRIVYRALRVNEEDIIEVTARFGFDFANLGVEGLYVGFDYSLLLLWEKDGGRGVNKRGRGNSDGGMEMEWGGERVV